MNQLKRDDELLALLEILATVYVVEERCIWCMALVNTPVQHAITSIHAVSCPTRRARVLLAHNGLPVKMWQVSFQHHRLNHLHEEPWNGSIYIVKHALTYEEACQRVAEHIVYSGNSIFVEGSVQVQEIATL